MDIKTLSYRVFSYGNNNIDLGGGELKIFQSILIFILCFQNSLVAHAESSMKAAFIREGNLWVKIDDKELQITDNGNAGSPEWSHDARWIAYSKQGEKPENLEIWAYNIEAQKNYLVFHHGYNFQWAPDRNLLAYQPQIGINLTDLRGDKPARTYDVAHGVDHFSWTPDGRGFLASSSACPRPDGWSNPVLFNIKLEDDFEPDNVFANAKEFFTIPGTLKKNNIEILSIGTSSFKWSPDKKWISFIVNPTASWSMDSNMLCILSSDGQKFEPLDEMASGFPFDWAPTSNLLGYIQGGGRMVFGFNNKNLKVKELPALQQLVLTPKNFVDLSFTWQSDENVVVSRSPELEWSNVPSKRALPILYRINILNKEQLQLSFPPNGYGDFNPEILQTNKKLSWTRSNWEKNNIWISELDGTSPEKWIENVDYLGAVTWYDPQ
ncbi:hypothetical protein [Ammoniphilus sp. YIM 78166]|uniref:TolB family protein n=1 Tax=Ammoniphilus sp. YIM 78166 TaxID=1644106 RepID=UPI00142FFCC1|nr:hypothetical protein [Ammoniphilus sp. YIM 78166]